MKHSNAAGNCAKSAVLPTQNRTNPRTPSRILCFSHARFHFLWLFLSFKIPHSDTKHIAGQCSRMAVLQETIQSIPTWLWRKRCCCCCCCQRAALCPVRPQVGQEQGWQTSLQQGSNPCAAWEGWHVHLCFGMLCPNLAQGVRLSYLAC